MKETDHDRIRLSSMPSRLDAQAVQICDRVAGLPPLASHAAERGGEKNLAATFPILPHAEGRIARPLRHRQLGISSGLRRPACLSVPNWRRRPAMSKGLARGNKSPMTKANKSQEKPYRQRHAGAQAKLANGHLCLSLVARRLPLPSSSSCGPASGLPVGPWVQISLSGVFASSQQIGTTVLNLAEEHFGPLATNSPKGKSH